MVSTAETGEASKEAVSASPFHVGEQKMQTLTGARDVSEQLGKRPTTTSRNFRHKDVQPTAVGSDKQPCLEIASEKGNKLCSS